MPSRQDIVQGVEDQHQQRLPISSTSDRGAEHVVAPYRRPDNPVRVARMNALGEQLIHASQHQPPDARRSRAMREEPSRHTRGTRYAVREQREQQERYLREQNAVLDAVVGGETRQNAIANATASAIARLQERREQLEARRHRAQETYHPTREQEAVASTALLPLLNHDADMVIEVLRLCWLYREWWTI